MNYCIVVDGIVENIIVCADDETAALFGAVSSYEGAVIGLPYNPPEPEEPVPEPSVWDELDAAYTTGYNEGYQEGVSTAYDQ